MSTAILRDTTEEAWMRTESAEVRQAIADSYEIPNDVVRDMPHPMVSVRTSAYQHVAFIKDCIDGVLAQQVDFPFEYLIGEDFSTDGTREVAMDYARRFPGVIRLVTADRNVGARANGRRTSRLARGKYIALCEGDDYWTDPCKLADQVAMLEADPSLSACVSDAWSETDGARSSFNAELEQFAADRRVINVRDLLRENFLATATIVLRRDRLLPLPDQIQRSPAGDWILLIHLAKQGGIGVLGRKTAVRRRHAGGRISMKDDVTKALFTVRCLVPMRDMLGIEDAAIVSARVAELRLKALDIAHRTEGLARAKEVWATFNGRDLPWRERARWWLLLHCPGLMRTYHRLRAGG